jgi:hypothetical protein
MNVLNCENVATVGGAKNKIWVFNQPMISAPVFDTNYPVELENFTLAAYNGFVYYGHDDTVVGSSEMVAERTAGVLYTHTVVFNPSKADAPNLQAIALLNRARNLTVVVEDNNAQFLVYGFNNSGLQVSVNTSTTGANSADPNVTVVTLSGRDSEVPLILNKGTAALTRAFLNGLVN